MTKFNTTLELDGKTATGINVPADIIEKLNSGKRPHVSVTINDYTFETTVGVMKGQYKIPVSADRRQAANVQAGDKLEVTIKLA